MSRIYIKNVNLTINGFDTGNASNEIVKELNNIASQAVKEAKEVGNTPQPVAKPGMGIVDKDTAPDGVYIATKVNTLIKPQFYGLYEGKVEPKGVVFINGGVKCLINPKQEDLALLEKCEPYEAKEFSSNSSACEDFNGKENTEALLKKNSPAAKWVKSLGEEYHLPSLGELKAANKFRDMINAAMLLIGDTPLNGWYWTSTRRSSYTSWLLLWNDGYVGYNHKGNYGYVRAFAAFN